MTRKNIFVIGLDDINRRMLETVRGADNYSFHNLVPYDEIVNPASYPMEKLLNDAREELKAVDGSIDAIIGHWDFPTTSMLPVLQREWGLRGPSLASVLECENKYWSRLQQRRAVMESTPIFQGIDPFDERAVENLELEYPFWLKPVIAFSSYLGFRIENPQQFRDALGIIRKNIGKFAEPFEYLIQFLEITPSVPEVHGGYCIAEQLMSGHLCTLEGYVMDGKVEVYGIVDSWRGPNQVSFERYELPSILPEAVQNRMVDYARRVIAALGLDNCPFNIEMFWNEEHDDVKILEINPRISKSHSPLFYMTAGASHHEVAVDVALGQKPQFPEAGGKYAAAAKFMPRTYNDTTVTRVPTQEDILQVKEAFPDTEINIHVSEGTRLSNLANQDSYSYEFADIFVGADSHEHLMTNFREIMKILDFRFADQVETNY